MRALKAVVRAVAPAPIFNLLKSAQRRIGFAHQGGFSEEEPLIARYLAELAPAHEFCVDIAAQDGVAGSQTLALFKRGWAGIAVEYDPWMFAILSRLYRSFPRVSLVRTMIAPSNVVEVLRAARCPRDFGFLSLDIDGYDHFVLERILAAFRPSFICVEINETIPPPLAFTVDYSDDFMWAGDHFQGQSIAKCHQLCARHDYEIVELHYNNLFLVPRELNRFRALSPEQAYDEGYRNKADRKEKFPWNADMDELLSMSGDEAARALQQKFAQYQGQYTLD